MSTRSLLIGIILAVLAVLLFLVVRGGKPEPDAVLRQCLDRMAAKDYNRMLDYCTPDLRAAYSNSIHIVHAHRAFAKNSTYTIGRIFQPAPGIAHIDVDLKFELHQLSPEEVSVRFNLRDTGKWYIENVWQIEPNGQMIVNALSNPPSANF